MESKFSLQSSNNSKEEEKFQDYWKVKLYWGILSAYPDGTYVVEFTSKGKNKIRKAYIHHELKTNEKMFDKVLAKLETFGPYISREMLEEMIKYATEKRKKGEGINSVSTEVLTSLLGGSYSETNAKEMHRKFENHIIEDLDLGYYPTVSSGNYDPDKSHGIILDRSDLKKKFGDNAVGVNRYTLLEFFIWGEDPEMTREEFNKSKDRGKRLPQLDEILQGWQDQGLLIKMPDTETNETRKNEVVINPYKGKDKERYYIIKCPNVYEALKNGKGGGRNE